MTDDQPSAFKDPEAIDAPAAPPPDTHEKGKHKKKKPPPEGLWRGWIRPLLTVILVVTALRSSLVDWNDVPTGSMKPTVAIGDRIVVNKLAYGFNLPFNGPKLAIPFTQTTVAWPLDFLPGFYYAAPKRNDIVTFWKPGGLYEPAYQTLLQAGIPEAMSRERITVTDPGIRMVKRVVAVPGDTVQVVPVVEKIDGRAFAFSKLVINDEEALYTDKRGIGLTETILGESRRVAYTRNDDGKLLHPCARAFGPVTLDEDEYLMIGDNRDNSQDGRFFGPVTLKQITGKAKFVAVSFKGGYFNPAWGRFFKGFDKDLKPSGG